ncbi:beta-galactosidase [Streptomyces sp. ST2-7A]|uniref:beta-galactosidase n=1 Tax=Streptomyces sp. ST2-7A TaxID=2907214 RepID=UPI002277A495|nr:beta-galactosidase [Streptomyces sp. ST2-7A]
MPSPEPAPTPVPLALTAPAPGAAVPPAPSAHLRMGSRSDTSRPPIGVDARSVRRGERPWIPVMGEYHPSRRPVASWRESLLLMRAGGVDTVASYVFWNQHEEHPGRFRFDGSLDVRRFVDLCAELELGMALRIGPWAHGECRNGGLPEWVPGRVRAPRTDDPGYLAVVRRWFTVLGERLRGTSYDEGGPVVAVQIENELYDDPDHLAGLRRIAEECGISAPLWTATAWGGARLPEGELLPLYGGYPEAFWEEGDAGPATGTFRHYIPGPIRDDHAIGADLRPVLPTGRDSDPGPDPALHPFATCELGGGMAIAHHRRPLIRPADISALALNKLASGSVWQGYYLYHGAEQYQGTALPNQESHDCGYPNDMPAVDYDFQAPIGTAGQIRPHHHALRAQHLFLREWGAELATMPARFPDRTPAGLHDRDTVRWSVRSRGDSGFLFLINHQPHEPLPAHEGVRFSVALEGRTTVLPDVPIDLPAGTHTLWPLGLALGPAEGAPDIGGCAGGPRLEWATARPVTRLEAGAGTGSEGPLTVLAADPGIPVRIATAAGTSLEGPARAVAPTAPGGPGGPGVRVHVVDEPGPGALFTVRGPDGATARLLVLDPENAARLYRIRWAGAERLVLADGPVVVDRDPTADGTEVLRLHPGEVPGGFGESEGPGASAAPRRATRLSLLPAPARVSGPSPMPGPVAEGAFTSFRPALPGPPPPVRIRCSRADAVPPPPRWGGSAGRASAPTDADFAGAARYRVEVPAEWWDAPAASESGDDPGDAGGAGWAPPGEGEVLLRVRVEGDAARALVGGRLVADHFRFGPPWEIGLRGAAGELRRHGALELLVLPPAPGGGPVHLDPGVRIEPGTAAIAGAEWVLLPRVELRAGEPRVTGPAPGE